MTRYSRIARTPMPRWAGLRSRFRGRADLAAYIEVLRGRLG